MALLLTTQRLSSRLPGTYLGLRALPSVDDLEQSRAEEVAVGRRGLSSGVALLAVRCSVSLLGSRTHSPR